MLNLVHRWHYADGGDCADGSSDESDDSEEPGAEGKGPSRSARRKKLKRQLRRQGLLDSVHKQAVPDGRSRFPSNCQSFLVCHPLTCKVVC